MSGNSATLATQAETQKRDSIGEIIAASMVGTAIEFYDNYCYSIAAAFFFPKVFFANITDPFLATLLSFTRSPSRSWRVPSARFCLVTSATRWAARRRWSSPS